MSSRGVGLLFVLCVIVILVANELMYVPTWTLLFLVACIPAGWYVDEKMGWKGRQY